MTTFFFDSILNDLFVLQIVNGICKRGPNGLGADREAAQQKQDQNAKAYDAGTKRCPVSNQLQPQIVDKPCYWNSNEYRNAKQDQESL